jgi:hypothetical protein
MAARAEDTTRQLTPEAQLLRQFLRWAEAFGAAAIAGFLATYALLPSPGLLALAAAFACAWPVIRFARWGFAVGASEFLTTPVERAQLAAPLERFAPSSAAPAPVQPRADLLREVGRLLEVETGPNEGSTG